MSKKLLINSLFLTLFASDAQAISINYPSKKTLNRIDHITSLLTTVSFIGYMTAKNDSCWRVWVCSKGFMSSAAMSVLVNVMALKYDKKTVTMLKLSLPAVFLTGLRIGLCKNGTVAEQIRAIVFYAITANCMKNMWDLASLIQDMQTGAHEEAWYTDYDWLTVVECC